MFRSLILRCSLLILAMAALSCAAAGAGELLAIGGDTYASGVDAALAGASPRSAFLSGFSVFLTGKVERDVYAAGFDVDVEAPAGGNLTAAGAAVKIAQPVAGDVTAASFSLHLGKDAAIGGNARLAGSGIVLDAPVSGSLVAAAGSLTVNGPIAGDVRLMARKLAFGPNARISGTLTYSAAKPVEIAPSVIPPERVHFEAIGKAPRLRQVFPALIFGAVLSLAVLVAAAAVFLAAMPQLAENLRRQATSAPFRSITLGILAFAMLAGLLPAAAMTLIGIPLIPILILAAVTAWIAGYLLGAYVLVMRAGAAFRSAPATLAGRLLALTAGLIVFSALTFVPILGWLLNLTLVFLGLGAIAARSARALASRDAGPPPGAGTGIAPAGGSVS